MARWFKASSVVLAFLLLPSTVQAACQLSKILDIPVTMLGRRPIVIAQINGRDARFILDSGAFFSTIAKANALEYGLPIREIAPGVTVRLKGVGGETSLSETTAKDFSIAGRTIPNVNFGVGGSDTGFAGLLGQNILGFADVEYDLSHGAVRLMKGQGCKYGNMAYWAGTKPFTIVEIEPMGPGQRHTIGTITINGARIKAVFDTGATGSMLTMPAAKRIGITPDSPGVVSSGFSFGLGQNRVRAWRTRLDSINIGGEAINKPWIQFADQRLDDADMLIGIDFFLTHRIYVDNQNHKMFVTYEGGPLFGLDPKGAVDSTGAPLDLTDTSNAPSDAAGYSRRGAIAATNRNFAEAIADFDKAVAMAPGDAHFVFQRAMARLANHQPLLGAADLDKAIALAPGDAEPRMARAMLRLGAHDPDGALSDLKVADQILAPSSDARLRLAGLYDGTGNYAPALASLDQWLKSHPEDHSRATAYNGRCWARALLNSDLDKALDDCNAALRLRPGEPAYLDSRGLVWFRRGDLGKALADYDAAVAAQPRNAWSLYVRSIVERRAGKTAQADTDRAAALAINPQVGERVKRFRIGE
jgi:tetratricopeptide (TPR) repeat protein